MSFKVAVLYGSVRTERKGINGAKFLVRKLKERNIQTTLLDAKALDFPLLDKMFKEYKEGEAPRNMEEAHQVLSDADGFVIVSGEYNHSIPPALKNLLDHFQSEFFFKPSAIATYSAGSFGGARVAAHLPAVAQELGMPSIPSIFYMPKVGTAYSKEGEPADEASNRRVGKFLDEFEWYMEAFERQREKGTPY